MGADHRHAHGHDHDHHHDGHGHDGHGLRGHVHAVDAGNERRVAWALALTIGFLGAEILGGLWSGSLALLADAGHMATDAAALALALAAFRAARKPATPRHTYGQHRFQVLAALINGTALFGIAAWIAVEAVQRLLDPVPVLGGPMLAIAVLGLFVNLAAFTILHGGDRENLNIRGAALHVLGDLLGSAAGIVAAGVVLWTGWTPIDPILSVLVAVVILRSAAVLVARSWHVLMEGQPDGLDLGQVRGALGAVPGVLDVHHVHAWSLTPGRNLLTLHLGIDGQADHDEVLHHAQRVLADRFGIDHATIQVERAGCSDTRCAPIH